MTRLQGAGYPDLFGSTRIPGRFVILPDNMLEEFTESDQ